ncbi:MAG TPA: hypothetical protein VGF67_26005 [Ktedonobacteraceae bacterium]
MRRWTQAHRQRRPARVIQAYNQALQALFVLATVHFRRDLHTERFLSQLAKAKESEALTTAPGSWTTRLWQEGDESKAPPGFSIDGHRKPVSADGLIPCGLIGRSGNILGGRALALFHDSQEHPLLAPTARGDQQLTVGLPRVLARYEQAGGKTAPARIIVDREGMAASFLNELAEAGHTVVTLLDQSIGWADLFH